MKKMKTHLVIGDPQARRGVPTDHVHALGRFIKRRQPDVIILIGDLFDFPSLSSFDEGTFKMEGRRLVDDIEAGNEWLEILEDYIEEAQEAKKDYDPELVFTEGNHEDRLNRLFNDMPKLRGIVKEAFRLDNWNVIPFQHIVNVDGISYSHYFTNPFSGRPYGGSVINRLNKVKFTHVAGHIQKLEYHNEHLNNGNVLHALTCGAFYMHKEDYKGPQGNHHFRGVCMLNNVIDGDFDLETIRIETLLNFY